MDSDRTIVGVRQKRQMTNTTTLVLKTFQTFAEQVEFLIHTPTLNWPQRDHQVSEIIQITNNQTFLTAKS